jgi:leader peptidase (prepilin peptidase)/N-methyltransferase
MTALVAVLAGFLGLAVGSFLNVVIHRVPAESSLRHPPSACPSCGARIRWFDNVPVVSWLILRRRCRDCSAPISIRYPLVEAGTAAAFVLIALAFAPDGWVVPEATGPALIAGYIVLAALLWLGGASIALTAIDLEVRRLPDRIVFPTVLVLAVLFAAASALLGDPWPALRALAGGAALCAFYLILLVVSRGGMGLGDVKLAAALGLAMGWIGWDALVVGALAAFVLGGLFGIALIVARHAGRRTAVPFGPWMIAGAWIGIVAGPATWRWYAAVLGLPVGV